MKPKIFGRFVTGAAAVTLVAGALVGAAPAAQAEALGAFSTTGSLPTPLSGAPMTVLPSGDVLVAGGTTGSASSPSPANVAALYDPAKGTWASTGSLPTPVYDATATLLANGDVLVAGGLAGSSSPLAATPVAQLYQPSTNTWATTGSMTTGRFGAVAERLANGDVLVAGGDTGTSRDATATSTAELFDPSNGTWSSVATLPHAVAFAQVAELAGGDVLVAGGVADSGAAPESGEATTAVSLYNPTDGSWAPAAPLSAPTYGATVTLLSSGNVLLAGGQSSAATLINYGEVYAQSDNSWSPTGAMVVPVDNAAAARLATGDVLVAGGSGSGGALAQAEVYSPASNSWTATGALPLSAQSSAAALLASGEVLVAGGTTPSGAFTASSELYASSAPITLAPTGVADFTVGQFGAVTIKATSSPTPTIAEIGVLPPGLVFTNEGNGTASISGTPSPGAAGTSSVEVVATNGAGGSASETLTIVVAGPAAPVHSTVPGTFNGSSSLPAPVAGATANLLPSGFVLVAGGYTGSPSAPTPSPLAWLYQPSNGTWSPGGALPVATYDATSTVLSNGAVLVAGGLTGAGPSSATSSAEIYYPADNTWVATQPVPIARFGAVARRLPNGEVLVAGGDTGTAANATATSSAELYNPATGSWSATGPLAYPTALAQAATLQSGNVLVDGGVLDQGGALGTGTATGLAQIYDPATGAWSLTGSSGLGRYDASEAVLPDGRVVVAGGRSSASVPLASTEIYNPASGQWSPTGSMPVASYDAASALLPDGDVLVAGGANGAGYALAQAELFSPSNGSWALTGSLEIATAAAAFARLTNGDVLVAGGQTTPTSLSAATELYSPAPRTAPGIAPVGALHFQVGRPGAFTITATGNPSPTISAIGTLPSALQFVPHANATATISGRPNTAGTYTVQVVASNGVGAQASLTITIVVSPAAPVPSKAKAPLLVAMVSGRSGHSYYLVTTAGNIYNHGGAHFYGSTATRHLPAPISAFALAPDGKGYWLADQAGDVYAFGDARVYSALQLNPKLQPVVAMVSSPSGHGYYLVSSKGNVYNFGDAPFYGSEANAALPHPIAAAALARGGRGYYLVGSGGEVYHLGPAHFYGLRAGYQLGAPVRAVGVTVDGGGYYLVTSAGNVYNYGDAHFYGSTATRHLPAPISAFALTPDGKGYWLADQAGDVYAFGEAQT